MVSYKPSFTITADILNRVADRLWQTLAQNAPVNAPVNVSGLKVPAAILRLIQHNPHFTRQQLADRLGKDVRTIGRAIAKLQQAGKLKRVGSDKTGYWELPS